mgnify:CR=1 FL=1
MVMPQSTLESLLFFLVLSLIASYLVKIKYGSNIKFRFHRYIAIFSYSIMIMPQSTLESLLFFLVLSLLASYLVKIKYGSNIKVQK